MNQKHQQNIYHANVNVNSIAGNVIQTNIGIVINVRISAKIEKNIMHVKKIIFRILLHVIVKMINM